MKLLKNYLFNLGYQLLNIILPIITVPYVTRILGPEQLGIYSFTGATIQYFILFGMLGIGIYGVRSIAKCQDIKERSRVFWEIYGLQLLFTFISYILFLIFFVGLDNQYNIYYFLQSFLLLATVFDISWFFSGTEQFKKMIFRNAAIKVISLAAIFIFVDEHDELLLYITILSLSTLLGQLALWLYMPKMIIKAKIKFRDIMSHAKPATALLLPQLAVSIYVLLDRTMLGIYSSNTDVGIYDQGQKLVKLTTTIVSSLGVVMLPRMSNMLVKNEINLAHKFLKNSFLFASLVAFPLSFGIAAIAPNFIPWFFGSEYQNVENVIYICSLIIIAIGWSNIFGIQYMVPYGKNKEFTISVTVAGVLNFILNLFLIKKYGYIGASISTLVTEFSVVILQMLYIKEDINLKVLFGPIPKILFASILMFIGVYFVGFIFEPSIISTMVQLLVGVLIYGMLIFSTKVLDIKKLPWKRLLNKVR